MSWLKLPDWNETWINTDQVVTFQEGDYGQVWLTLADGRVFALQSHDFSARFKLIISRANS